MSDSWIGRKPWRKQMRYFRCLQLLIVTVLIGFDLPKHLPQNRDRGLEKNLVGIVCDDRFVTRFQV